MLAFELADQDVWGAMTMRGQPAGGHARELRAIADLLAVFREFDPQGRLPIQTAQIFVLIALNQGCTLGDIEKAAGVSQSAASRNALILAEGIKGEATGLGLVVRHPDPEDSRRRQLYLTRRGFEVAKRLIALFLGVHENKLAMAFGAPTAVQGQAQRCT